MDLGEDGHPIRCRAVRARLVGKQSVLTPWFGTCQEFREWEGFNMASRVEAGWQLPEGPFVYFRSEIASLTAKVNAPSQSPA